MVSRHANRAKNGGFNYAPTLNNESVLNAYALGETLSLTVQPRRELFRNEDSGWSIYLVEHEDHRFKISGTFAVSLCLNGFYDIKGTISEYKNERQIVVQSYSMARVRTPDQILIILRSIEELNTIANQVYNSYGPKILDDIMDNPKKVARKLSLPLKTVERWKKHLTVNGNKENAFDTLKKMGFTDKMAKKILDVYDFSVVEKIKENPYFLIDNEELRFSFAKCDEFALSAGYPFDGFDRITHAITYVIKKELYNRGDCYLKYDDFYKTLSDQLCVKLGYFEANGLIKSPNEIIDYTKGSVRSKINKKKLIDAMNQWHASFEKKPFCFVLKKVSDKDINLAIETMISNNTIIKKDCENKETIITLTSIENAEKLLAERVMALVHGEHDSFDDNATTLLAVCEQEGVTLEHKQEQAAIRFTKKKGGLFILNGAAGCGKTFVLNIIIKVLESLYRDKAKQFKASILAPTGKAAQVAENATGLQGATIHRAIGYGGSMPNEDLLNCDCLIIDEFSMVDILLASKLFNKITPNTKVIVLGDTEQLPSIMPGSVLRDLIKSNLIEVVTLDVVKRQTEGSAILHNSQNILTGQPIEHLVNNKDGDAYVLEIEDQSSIRSAMLNAIQQSTRSYGIANVQILCPQKKTQIGTEIMNYCVQQIINPTNSSDTLIPAKKIKFLTTNGETEKILYFKKGDKVIHTKNNKDTKWYYNHKNLGLTEDFDKKGIINGEIGIIIDIVVTKKEKKILVQYDSGIVIYTDDFADLEHAYAITIHKSQGSQWPVVISPISRSNRIMLNRKLLYTLYTRAQTLSIVIGDRPSMNYAVKNDKDSFRNTTLIEKLYEIKNQRVI